MTLSKSGLKSDIEDLAASPGATIADCAQAWADAMQTYAGGVVPPSAAVASAAATLKTALQSAFANSVAATTAAAMEAAFAAFGAAVGVGMAPVFTATPPAGAVGFAALFAAAKPATHTLAATAISDAIDTWMKAGTATLVAPPNTVSTWS
jgi:hypothetical protein